MKVRNGNNGTGSLKVGLLDDLEGRSDAEIQALLVSVTEGEPSPVSQVTVTPPKLRISKTRPRKWDWEPLFDNLNQTVTVEIELPAYMVAAMTMKSRRGVHPYREAVRDYLEDVEWAQPMFRRSLAAIVQDSKDKFTRSLGKYRFTI